MTSIIFYYIIQQSKTKNMTKLFKDLITLNKSADRRARKIYKKKLRGTKALEKDVREREEGLIRTNVELGRMIKANGGKVTNSMEAYCKLVEKGEKEITEMKKEVEKRKKDHQDWDNWEKEYNSK